MRTTPYYSVRTGKNPSGGRFGLEMFTRLFASLFSSFDGQGYFQEAFGYYCVDSGYVPGFVGDDIGGFLLRKLKKDDLWPVHERSSEYLEDDVFDLIELLYDVVSSGTEGGYHSYSDCGWHYREFDKTAGRREFRIAVNEILREYQDGYELSQNGEILSLPPQGLSALTSAALPPLDDAGVTARVEAAVHKFRRRGASSEDRRDAIRDLVDVLEYLRPRAKKVLKHKDEQDLFNIANSFGIRHHRPDQRTEYDKPIWYSWMFYYYLATIHAAVRLIDKAGE